MKVVNILGEIYKVYFMEGNVYNDGVLVCGYCDYISKEIFIDTNRNSNNETLKHEIIHAILFESGIEFGYNFHNEDVVNYFAVQLNKINKAVEEALK